VFARWRPPCPPPLAPAKVLRSDAAVPTRQRSLRVLRAARSMATAASEGPRSAAVAAESQQAVAVPSAAMTTAVAAPSVPPAPAPIDDSQAAVVEIPDNDVPPPGWDKWVSLLAPAAEPPTGGVVVRDDGSAALGCPVDGTGPRHRAPPSQFRAAPRHIRSRSRSASAHRRPTLSRPRPSRSCGRSFTTTALHSTER
jgi:hypothetical protein